MPVHPTAIIDRRAEVDSSAEVGPFCVIDGDVTVGAGCRLYQNVYLTGWTRIGEKCELHPYVIVGHAPQDIKYQGQRTFCTIGRGTILRENVTIHRGTEPETTTAVGEECFLLGGAHVAHNCTVGNRVTLINNVLLAGHVEVHEGATLGGAAVVHQFVRIGELAMIAGNARVVKDIVPFGLADVEGRIAGLNRIGLRRAGLFAEETAAIREAYRAFFDTSIPYEKRMDRAARVSECAAVRRLMEFVRAPSKRGLAGRSRRSAAPGGAVGP